MKKTKRALLIQADTTQTLPMARSLAAHGWDVGVVVSSRWTYGYGTRFARRKYIFHDYENIEAYSRFILDILRKEKYDIIIPMADHGAQLLSYYKDELLPLVRYVMPSRDIFDAGFDKHRLMDECRRLGIPHPATVAVEQDSLPMEEIEALHFPVLIKPNKSCGARGITPCSDIAELKEKFPAVYAAFGPCHIQELIPPGGRQVAVQLYIGPGGELVQSSVISKTRWYPNKGGSSCCNEAIENPAIVGTCHRLLKSIGWTGFADFDTIEDPRSGELLIMELNPRVPACVKTAFAAGIDWATVISSEYMGEPHPAFSKQRDVWLRFLGFEMLWFMNASDRWHTRPNWFKFFGRNIYYQDMNGISDPMPFIRGTLGNVAKQLSPSFRKAKAGMN